MRGGETGQASREGDDRRQREKRKGEGRLKKEGKSSKEGSGGASGSRQRQVRGRLTSIIKGKRAQGQGNQWKSSRENRQRVEVGKLRVRSA